MKKIIASFIMLFLVGISMGQIGTQTQQTSNKWRMGVGAGLGFGNNGYFGFNISPRVGYDLGSGLEAGVSLGYQLTKNNYFKNNLFSGGPYVHYSITPQLFGRAHYEYYTGQHTYKANNSTYSINESALWLGAGYQTIGKVGFRTGILYNVLYKEDKSIFASAIRPFAGVVFSF